MTKAKLFLLLLFCIPVLRVHAQLEKKNWLFGPTAAGLMYDYSALTFTNTTKATPFNTEGCGVMSNPLTGDLIFYSDGQRVFDATHTPMPNGSGLISNLSTASTGLFCRVPGSCNLFYVFSNNCLYDLAPSGIATGDLHYSTVDMTLPGNGTVSAPLGDVAAGSKNVLLQTGISEALLVISSNTSEVSWLVCYLPNTNTLKVFRIDLSGFSTASTYTLPFPYTRPMNFSYSPISKKISCTSHTVDEPVVLFDFDNSTGNVASHMIVPGTPFMSFFVPWIPTGSSEWSPDGSKLYISRYRSGTGLGGQFYQYDMSLPLNPPMLIYQVPGGASYGAGGLKQLPDGRIVALYRNLTTGDMRWLAVFEEPNEPGLLCNFNPFFFSFPVDPGNTNKFPDFYYPNEAPVAQSDPVSPVCSGANYVILPLQNDADAQNQPLSLSLLSVAHGSATVSNDSVFYSPLAGYTGMDTVFYLVCDNDCFQLCDTGYIAFDFPTLVDLDLGPPIFSCLDSVVIGPDPYAAYLWSTGENTQYISVDTTGTYTLTVTNTDGCTGTDSVEVNFSSQVLFDLGQDLRTCQSAVSLTGNVPGLPYNWSTGESASAITVNEPGLYTAEVMVCGHLETDSVEVFFIRPQGDLLLPNVFTPNGDGINDEFRMQTDTAVVAAIHWTVYNRWGQLVFESHEKEAGWNGTFQDQAVPEGTYFFMVTITYTCIEAAEDIKKGHVSIFR